MLIIGAKGFAKEVLEVLHQQGNVAGTHFYDDVSGDVPDTLYGVFPVIRTASDARRLFQETGPEFTIGIGNPALRWKLHDKFSDLGGVFTATISPKASIGSFGNEIGAGSNIMTGTVITNDVRIGKGALINLNCTIGHDCTLGDFVELSPGVHISGNCHLGDFVNVGTNATVLPKIRIGNNVTIGAGSVVTRDVEDNAVVVGIPAKIIKHNPPLAH